MRIGILKQQINYALNEVGELKLDGEQIYGGQAYRVKNFQVKSTLIFSLVELGLVKDNILTENIRTVLEGIRGKDVFEIDSANYGVLNNFFVKLNNLMPVLRETVNVFTPDQEEKIINIKLPSDIHSLKELRDYNERLNKVFAKFGINETNGLKFVGFDIGSEWYQILIDNSDFFKWIIVGIGIAWSCIKIRKEWFDSEISRLTLKAMKDNNKKDLKKEDTIVKEVLDVKISEEVDKAFSNGLPDLGRKKDEATNQMTLAVHAIIDEMDKGTEFHLSLNPPKEISEVQENNLVKIDYSSVYQIDEKKDDDLKEIESGNTN